MRSGAAAPFGDPAVPRRLCDGRATGTRRRGERSRSQVPALRRVSRWWPFLLLAPCAPVSQAGPMLGWLRSIWVVFTWVPFPAETGQGVGDHARRSDLLAELPRRTLPSFGSRLRRGGDAIRPCSSAVQAPLAASMSSRQWSRPDAVAPRPSTRTPQRLPPARTRPLPAAGPILDRSATLYVGIGCCSHSRRRELPTVMEGFRRYTVCQDQQTAGDGRARG